ncbi:uncharacterized protein LOC124838289 isoform X2 [Vigna umbellata]|uniref:uncharacterized protein LOC124838289 isoform X2 n=1 Tax=Vigna umbellata TaxID=87088 RepID=UPI001F5E4573|nr:uncharacterized protein LOC124838289 isoform X2 [Vigna umbellata]
MDILKISNLSNFSIPSFCQPKALKLKFPPNYNKPTSPFRRTPFSVYLSRSTAVKFQTWAHSGRPTKRRNSLRKKLLRDHKVIPNQIPNDPLSVSGNGFKESGVGVQGDSVVEAEKSKSKLLGESVLWNKLDSWVDQYKRDIEYWGVGSGPVFTVYEDSLGGVKRVSVDEEEILKRSKDRRDVIGDFPEVRSKILNAKNMAREMESGNNVIARNSSVTKFVVHGKEEGGFVKAVRGFVAKPQLLPRLSRVGRYVLYVLVVMWVVKKLFAFGEGDKEVECTALEKEMMRRKMKARKEKEKLVKGAVEVIVEPSETPVVDIKMPQLDKEQLRNNILKAKGSSDKLVVGDSSDKIKAISMEMDYKVQEIKEMARQARKIEGRDNVVVNKDLEMDDSVIRKSSDDNEFIKRKRERDDSLSDNQIEVVRETTDSNVILQSTPIDVPENIDNSVLHEVVPADEGNVHVSDVIVSGDKEIKKQEIEFSENNVHLKDKENDNPLDTRINGSSMTNENFVKKKRRIIRSVKEARDYLSSKHDKQNPGAGTASKLNPVKESITDLKSSSVVDFKDQKSQNLKMNTTESRSETLNGTLDSKSSSVSDFMDQKSQNLKMNKTESRSETLNGTLDSKSSSVSDFMDQKSQNLKMNIARSRSDTLNGTLDSKSSSVSDFTDQKSQNSKMNRTGSRRDTLNRTLDSKPVINDHGTLDSKSSIVSNFTDQKSQNLKRNTTESRSDTLNGTLDSKPVINDHEDSTLKDKELIPRKNDYNDSGVEPGAGIHQKSVTTFDSGVNGTGTTNGKSENWPEKNLLEVEQIISDGLNGLSDSKPFTKPIEDSNPKNKEFSPMKDDYFKDSGVEPGVGNLQKYDTTLDHEINSVSTETRLPLMPESGTLNGLSDSKPATNPIEVPDQKNKELGTTEDDYLKVSGVEPEIRNHLNSGTTLDDEVNDISTETKVSGKTENWLEKNFHEVEPIVNQIRVGFRNNYMAAKERVDQPLDMPTEMESLRGVGDDGELDWMQDDHLRDIVFRVRENELSGRDPFYLMSDEDKDTFFRGLEKKVEKENIKLSHVHEWLHSNIENLNYGADGISIYDPLEKIIPHWKGPAVEKIPEFLNEFLDERKTGFSRNMNPVKKDESGFAITSSDSSSQEKFDGPTAPTKKLKNPRTIIEGSDGSVKAGKKSGKEYWQHTKKWSQGFLDCYNDETDPEVKSIMKDMGKDLDRWITEKEIKEAAELMDKLPDRNKSFIEKKLNKVKREMELFGPQAVVSKYREYADDEEEDYLWWLDLPHILCIELYTVEEGEQKVGLYSLEMAGDLELEPKPHHVIAFQDPNDCKNLCYIIQAHLEMLGNGHAFVVARPPKDAFREAKANGFGVTVIKKGELQLNIDQPLEEVDELITEIGSKMYHDMMMKERSVDINTLMKGVFGFNDRSIKRLKRKLKKSRKG